MKRGRRKAPSERIEQIRFWHKRAGLDQPWTRDRFNRLCRLLNCTGDELGNVVCVYSGSRLKQWLEANAIPPYVALNLQMIENAYMQVKHGTASEPLLPVHLIG